MWTARWEKGKKYHGSGVEMGEKEEVGYKLAGTVLGTNLGLL